MHSAHNGRVSGFVNWVSGLGFLVWAGDCAAMGAAGEYLAVRAGQAGLCSRCRVSLECFSKFLKSFTFCSLAYA
jgi:hypothetical protein